MNRREKDARKKAKRAQKRCDRARSQTPRRYLPMYPGPDLRPRRFMRVEIVDYLMKHGWSLQTAIEAVRFSQACSDDVTTQAMAHPEIGPLPECSPGCSYCCHMRVEVWIPEALIIADYLRAHLNANELTSVRTRIAATAELARTLTTQEFGERNTPCPLLQDDGSCSVYEVRPHVCRNYHSCSAQACRDMFDDLRAPAPPMNENLCLNRSALDVGTREGFDRMGHRMLAYELTQCLLIALDNHDAGERWARGEDVFASARAGIDDVSQAFLDETGISPADMGFV